MPAIQAWRGYSPGAAMKNGTHSIMVVDDDPAVLRYLRQVLTGAGYEVVEAADGKQALTQFNRNPTDVLITDLIMPEQEGVETITKLRRQHPRVGIIAISGAVGGKYLRVAEILGAGAILQKPFGPDALLAAVKRVSL